MTEPRRCFTIIDTQFHPEKGYIPSLVIEGEAGHQPAIGADELAQPWYWGRTLEEAQAVCDQVNRERFGLSPEDATAIVNSSLAASIRSDATKARFERDYERKLGR